MLDSSRRAGYLLLLAGLFPCLHAVCLRFFQAHATGVTYLFLILAASVALAGCCWRTWQSTSQARMSWGLFSVGLFLWTLGMSLSAWEELLQHTPFSIAFASDFVYFLYGAPILLAISSSADTERLPLFIWMDGVQGVLTAFLVYVAIFSVSPFSSGAAQPISLSLLTLTYDAENLFLAVAATLRLIAQPKGAHERSFYQILCGYLWVYALFAGIYNHVSAITEGHSLDPIVDIPFLMLAVIALSRMPANHQAELDLPRTPLARFIDNASPMFYTLALSVLGVLLIRRHFSIGLSAIAVAVAVYGIRTITLQGRLMQSQQALKQARDRLETISLRDGLTNVANRRCFDQTLTAEWNRAVRMQHSIALVLIDIDHFKHLNDTYGHQAGDQCLIALASAMQSSLIRSGDLLARYGGEEFSIILPATGLDCAKVVAATIHDAVHALHFRNETSSGDFVTVSIGVAVELSPLTGSPENLIKSSDLALYKAKQNGRDRMEIA
jgi:diguanylate cyclase (GGDEF)-like protein